MHQPTRVFVVSTVAWAEIVAAATFAVRLARWWPHRRRAAGPRP
ncbi:hypothetical protein [Alloactinosynnema sp. L-07]|nr:hypothetical protein [Alloactinosynnema sp. L-07]